MTLNLNKLIAKIRLAFEAITPSIRAFWQNHLRSFVWTLGLILLIHLAAALFIWLWPRSRLFRTLVLIAAAALVTDRRGLMEWLTKRAAEIKEAVAQEAPMTQEIPPDTHEAPGNKLPQKPKVEPESMPV